MKKLAYVVAGIILAVSHAQAGQFTVDGDSEFIAIGKPGFIKINGKGGGLKGFVKVAGTKITGEFKFPLGRLDTGVGLRDDHMKKDYLEVPKYPEAKLVINEVKINGNPEAKGFQQKQVPFNGVMTLHGVSKDVSGTIDLENAGDLAKGLAQFEFKITDFGFVIPKYLGMTVNENVHVKVRIEAKKSKAG